ncbi:uncharacterized protein BYT42DRAFT_619007 [Radiomyces spectabilis]|uniref:uncharacterized protein n=1 Tax=Radiomyces spectabilis TaxID=64574 RepID=UPI00221FF5CA|nr:uncharacterized protein BYT42DRAFT_619007 [Radiomyces spectabilis]KAI8364150.1 hypothetical protein BYT42DRAFT_619007 [Radiomyces spectabilis]
MPQDRELVYNFVRSLRTPIKVKGCAPQAHLDQGRREGVRLDGGTLTKVCFSCKYQEGHCRHRIFDFLHPSPPSGNRPEEQACVAVRRSEENILIGDKAPLTNIEQDLLNGHMD